MYGFAMILWYLAARKTEPFLPLQKELAFAAIVDGKVSELPSILHTLNIISRTQGVHWFPYMPNSG